MKLTLIVTTIVVISVCLCAATGIQNRRRRSISESTRFQNEYDNSDHRLRRPNSNIDNANEGNINPANPTQNCVPGTRWKQDCNRCVCSKTGNTACTYMLCLGPNNNNFNQYRDKEMIRGRQHRELHNRLRRSEDNIEVVQPIHPIQPIQQTLPTASCVPGTTWRQACNTCYCTDTGIGVCTLRGCLNFEFKPHQQLTSSRRRRSSSGNTRPQNSTPTNETKKCKNGTFWMDDCNRCRCLRGRYACTRMMCPTGDKRTNVRMNLSPNTSKI